MCALFYRNHFIFIQLGIFVCKLHVSSDHINLTRTKHELHTNNGQFIITVPKAIAESMQWKKGTELEFVSVGSDLILQKVTK